MSQQRATDQNMATSSSSNSNNNNNQSDVITLDDDDEDGEVIFVGHVRPTGSTIDLCLTPSTSAAAAAAARSGSSSGTADDDPGSRATASASNPLSPASSPADAAKSVTVDAGTTISVGDPLAAAAAALECPICLQTCIHPARLPCGHIFCFLCVKGVAYKNPRCAMCRREIPVEFLDHPQLVNGIEDICTTRATEDGYQWYYEGRNGGWWAYDSRTNGDIEIAYADFEKHKAAKPPQSALATPLDSIPDSDSGAMPPNPALAPQNQEDPTVPMDLSATAKPDPEACEDQPFGDPCTPDMFDNDTIEFADGEDEDMYDDYDEDEEVWMSTDSEDDYCNPEIGPHPGRLHLQICGSTYVIDFLQMKQYPRSNPERRRNIQRCKSTDAVHSLSKGVAGLSKHQRCN
ncbi:uncharacterized protein LOC128257878 isoform X2 [Drosophila gunungcola]|uniref:uncharacterized protein LOC128257878 isoform X2 n=1 Tax=Drosophila gunungcola TaxID=103775 RepID=UPI0022DF199C|nr:uncharacterized protein LOC128257878 isoform X2 [Drosophila gunungcola]